jgi:hypothetical protein
MTAEFSRRMTVKGHAASIEFLHGGSSRHASAEGAALGLSTDEGELRLSIITDATARGQLHLDAREAGLSVGALSGGEKSFASLILLSAIANVADPPFRIVDEFDVFQDETTRRESTRHLLADAQQADPRGRFTQYILLTPHGMAATGAAINKEHLAVWEMPKPQRNARG